MGLGIRLDESYEPVTRVMHYPSDTNLASHLAMHVIVLQDNDRLFPAFSDVLNIARVEVTIIAPVSTDWADAFLLGKQPRP